MLEHTASVETPRVKEAVLRWVFKWGVFLYGTIALELYVYKLQE